MYFKRLTLCGFKSFAEKTTLEFEPGVTAVVGPNGCGKSNISDGIRWVLGEQSARSMRGSSMEDVIFNGTTTLAAVNFAEVSLVLSNENKNLPIEYDEIEITRRLYRSGESEYLLNKNLVRLRDIQDLLMGSGLGVSNYSVIEQGKIDALISAKPDHRRELFDEAAGITRYKANKDEALRKLELTEANLLRVNDIIIEVKRQIGSMERQAKKAESYKKDFEKLKNYDIVAGLQESANLTLKRAEMQQEINDSQTKIQNSEFALQDTNVLLKEARERLSEIEHSYSHVKTQLAVLEKDVNNNAEKKTLFENILHENAKKEGALQQGILHAEKRIETLTGELAELEVKFRSLDEEARVGEEHLRERDAAYAALELEIKNTHHRIDETKRALVQSAAQLSQLRNESTKIESSLHNLANREHRLHIELTKVSEEFKSTTEQYDGIARQVEELSQQIREKALERENLEEELRQVEHVLRTTEEKLQQLSNESSGVKSRLDVLQDITARHEGFSQGVRHVLGMNHSGVLGALADLVEVDRGYELALETALEFYAQSLICRTDHDVLELMGMLAREGKGKATFVSLEEYQQGSPRFAVSAPQDTHVRPLSDFTRAQSTIAKFYGSLIQNIYVADTIDRAMHYKKQYPDIVFVTKNGELSREGIAIGGSADTSDESLLFGRESKIRELKARLAEIDLDVERLQFKKDEFKQKQTGLEERGKEYEIMLPKLQVQLADLARQQDNLGKLKAKLNEEKTVAELELQETAQETQELRARSEETRAHIATLERERADGELFLRNSETLITESAKAREELLIQITRLRQAQETLIDRRAGAERDFERVRESLEQQNLSKTNQQQELVELRAKNELMQQNIRQLDESTVNMQARIAELLEKNKEIIEQRNRWQMNVKDLETKKAGAEEAVIGQQKKHHDLQLMLNQVEHSTQRLNERVIANYQVDLAGLTEEERGAYSASELIPYEEAERIRGKLAHLGPVNLIAIEEYDELKKRYDFLTKEQQDLIQSKDDIHKAILKINRTTREKFIEAFTKIQTAFVEYYKLLFGGGTAELILLDENDVLESGIEIVARPPGKKLQTISLLSGGEKALTATALLFSVLRVKPSPFVVLDEVDAPLDEVNVQRFASVLREFTKESQFIIITHNKRTMSLADVMYGVTMQQTGMSRVVSVKFSDSDLQNTVSSPRKVPV